MRQKDIVEDIFFRVKTILGQEFSNEIADKQEEQRIRNEWGGSEPYIPKRNKERANQKALEQLKQGIPVKKIASNTGISVAQAYILLKRKK